MPDDGAAVLPRRITILHYTAQPEVGGVESLIGRQCAALRELTHRPRCVVGRGSGPAGIPTMLVPAMDPSSDEVKTGLTEIGTALPHEEHPLVQQLLADLEAALNGCTDCWVHNALTVSLNPFLSVALMILISRHRDVRWVAWTADLSCSSRFVGDIGQAYATVGESVRELVTWVAISAVRRSQLSEALRLPSEQIQVIHPPFDVLDWLGVGRQARRVVRHVNWPAAGPIVLVPSKSLPHKCLERAVQVGIRLAQGGIEARVILTAAPSPHEPWSSQSVLHGLRRTIELAGAQSTVILLPDLLRVSPSDRTVRDLMLMCDVVLLPSVEEGFGLPLREAAALGVPVVCTDIPVFREAAGDYATYFRQDQDDVEVASLVLAATAPRRHGVRRAALTSMIQFKSDLENLLQITAQPKE